AGNYTPVALPQATDAELAGIADALVAAERPLILTGGGVVRSATGPLARELGDAIGAVFMHSLTASNVTGSPHSLGIAGGLTPECLLTADPAGDRVLILRVTSK